MISKTKFLVSIGLLLIAGLLFAVPVIQKSNEDNKTEVVMMNKSIYIKNIYDYEKNPNTFVYKDNKPSVIDFYADWCGPCRRISPIMDELSVKYKGKVNFYKVNVDFEKELASIHGITNIPVVALFHVKGEPQLSVGALQKEKYIEMIENILIEKK